jgi:hypothetical protein
MDFYSGMCAYGTLKEYGGDEPNRGTIYVYMEMSHRHSLCNHHIPIKKLKTNKKKHSFQIAMPQDFHWVSPFVISAHLYPPAQGPGPSIPCAFLQSTCHMGYSTSTCPYRVQELDVSFLSFPFPHEILADIANNRYSANMC